jgi:translocation and assembly module TamB
MRRRLLWTAGIAGGLGVLLVALVLGVWLAGNSARGRVAIERLTARLTSGHVILSGLGGSFPDDLTLRELQLRDAQGVWLSAAEISVHWSPLALLHREVSVQALHAGRVAMERAPVSSSPDSGPITIPTISIDRFAADRVELGAALAGVRTLLVVRGGGELRTLEDANADIVATRVGGVGHYEVHFRFDRQRMDASLQLAEPASGPLEHLLQLPGLGALSAHGELRGPRTAERIDLVVDAGELHARAAGLVDLRARAANLDLSLRAAALAPRSDLGWQRIDLEGHVQGSLTAPTVALHALAVNLRLPGGFAVANADATVHGSAGTVALQSTLSGLTLPGAAANLLRADPIELAASLRLDAPDRPLQLDAKTALFTLSAQASTAGRQSAALKLRLADFAPLAALAGQRLRGHGDFDVHLTRGRGGGVEVDLDAATTLDAAPASWDVLGKEPKLHLAGRYADAAISVDDLRVSGRALQLNASGSATRSSSGALADLQTKWSLALADLATLSPALAGDLHAAGQLHGPPAALAVTARLNSSVSVRGSARGTLTGSLDAVGLPHAPTGRLQIAGALADAPLALEIRLARDREGLVRATVEHGDWKSAHLHGSVTLGGTVATTRGRLDAEIAQVADLAQLLGLSGAGSMAGSLDFAPEHGATQARMRISTQGLQLGGFAGEIQLTGRGPIDALQLQLGVQMPDWRGDPASLTAALSIDLPEHQVQVHSLAARLHGEDLRLLAPTAISYEHGIAVDELRLGALQAQLLISGRVTPDLDVQANLHGVGPTVVNLFAPGLLAAGQLDAQAQLHGSLAAPQGEAHVDGVGLRFAGDAGTALPGVDVHAALQLHGESGDLEATLAAGTDSHLSLRGSLPFDLSAKLDLQLAGTLNVALISPLLEARGLQAAGTLNLAANVTGTAGAPEIGGSITLSKGSLHDYNYGTDLTAITASISGSDGALKIDSLTARAAAGTLSMTGTIGVLQPKLPVDLQIIAKNAQPIASTLVTATVDGGLHVHGTARERLDVDGKIEVDRATIGIPRSLPPNVAVLDVRRRGQAVVVRTSQLVVGLDVAVHASPKILVQGRGLDAYLGGALKIGGTTIAPVVSGAFDLDRGSFSIAGATLTFTSGRVSFDEEDPKNKFDPTLNFIATTQVTSPTTANVTLIVTGLATAPRFTFSSDPSLPQDEILAGLLFNTNAANLSAVQLAQIGGALAVLSGVGGDGGFNPILSLQKSLGLDRLTVAQDTIPTATGGTTNNGYSVAAGRYVSKRIYVEGKQSTTGTSQVQIDVDLTKHLKLQTRLGNGTATTQGTTPENDPGSSIGLQYQIEY